MAVDSLQFPRASGHMEPTECATKIKHVQSGGRRAQLFRSTKERRGAPAALEKSTCNCLLRTSARFATHLMVTIPLRTQL
jgi:hypothetical protein